MTEIMIQEEIDKVLSVAEEEAAPPSAPAGPPVTYDFKHPARVNKAQLRTLESLHDNFARLLGSTFSGAMAAVVDVDTAFVDQTTYAEFIMSLSNPSCSYQFTLGPTKGQAIFDIPLPLAYAFVDRLSGGKGSSQGVDPKQPTALEMGLINKIVKRVIEDLEATWAPILSVEISDVELETNPQFMQISAASEIVILFGFKVSSPNASGLVSLCYPFFTLERILARLGQPRVRPPIEREALRLHNRLRLGPASLELRAELGRTRLTVGALRRLQVGEVIELDARLEQPAVVWVGDQPKYLAWPFAAEKGRLHLKMAGELSPGRQLELGT